MRLKIYNRSFGVLILIVFICTSDAFAQAGSDQKSSSTSAPLLANSVPVIPNFEQPDINSGGLEYNPSGGGGWTFEGLSGLSKCGATADIPQNPAGKQIAFVEGRPGSLPGRISTVLNFSEAGFYSITLTVARLGAQIQSYAIKLDDVPQCVYVPSETPFAKIVCAAINVSTKGTHKLSIEAVRNYGAPDFTSDQTVLIGQVSIFKPSHGTIQRINVPSSVDSASWSRPGGPTGNWVTGGIDLAESFRNKTPKVLWSANVGLGKAPVVVKDGVIYAWGFYREGTDASNITSCAQTPNWTEIDEWESENKIKNGEAVTTAFDTALIPNYPQGYFERAPAVTLKGADFATAWKADTGALLWAHKITDFGAAWDHDTFHAGIPASSPLIEDGLIYIYSDQGQLYCLHAKDGTPAWVKPANMFDYGMWSWCIGNSSMGTSPIKAGNVIVVEFMGSDSSDYTKWARFQKIFAGFDATTGEKKWVTKAPGAFAFYNSTQLTYALINGEPTVLGTFGSGVAGIDPANGKIRWSFATPYQSLQFTGDCRAVAFDNYVLTESCYAHDGDQSATSCYQIVNNVPSLVWENHLFVGPTGAGNRNGLVAWDGKLYGFDAHGCWDHDGIIPTVAPNSFLRWCINGDMWNSKGGPDVWGRNYRGDDTGRFQCWDIATGKLLWSTDQFDPLPGEIIANYFIIVGSNIIATSNQGMWINKINDGSLDIIAKIDTSTINRYFSGISQLGQPVFAGTTLYIRQIDCNKESFVSLCGPAAQNGNLIAFDLRANESSN